MISTYPNTSNIPNKKESQSNIVLMSRMQKNILI